MYKKVYQVVEHLLKFKNFDQLKINTNGTIVPKKDKIHVFQDERVFLISLIMEIFLEMLKI